jgi:hypothetical protein
MSARQQQAEEEAMSQSSAARHGPQAKSEDEDVTELRARRPAHQQGARPGRRPGQTPDDGGVGPDQPEDGDFELIGDDDLSAADLGPAAPNATDPDADSGRARKLRR